MRIRKIITILKYGSHPPIIIIIIIIQSLLLIRCFTNNERICGGPKVSHVLRVLLEVADGLLKRMCTEEPAALARGASLQAQIRAEAVMRHKKSYSARSQKLALKGGCERSVFCYWIKPSLLWRQMQGPGALSPY